jgi:nitrogen-specific signal transduction histidine kinase
MPSSSQSSLINRLVETDHAGRILYATPEAGVLFGISPRHLAARDLPGLFLDDQQVRRLLRSVVASGSQAGAVNVTRDTHLEVRITAERQDSRRLLWRLAPVAAR